MAYRQRAIPTTLPLDELDRVKLQKRGRLIYVAVAMAGVGLFFAYIGVSQATTGEWKGVLVIGTVCVVIAALTRLVWQSGAVVYLDLKFGKKERFATRIDDKRVRSHGPDSSPVYLLRFGDREDAVSEAEYRAFCAGDEVVVERAARSRVLLYVQPLSEAEKASLLVVRDNGG
jgi:hypothetical protein